MTRPVFDKVRQACFRLRRGGRAAGLAVPLLALLLVLGSPSRAPGFTQLSKGITPVGHEWITRIAALELIGGDRLVSANDPNDPRASSSWKVKPINPEVAAARNEVERIRNSPVNDATYGATYSAVWAAIMGQRWVDLAGFDVTKEKIRGAYQVDCWDFVDQQPGAVQYDHFLRRDDDEGGEGGVRAAHRARERFVQYFVAAAMAPQGTITFYDGGASSDRNTADRNYFLFGRAVHLFEDSFSPEHTVRREDDGYRRVRQVKSYICTAGSEQHRHEIPSAFKYGAHGDIIWTAAAAAEMKNALLNPQPVAFQKSYRASNLTTEALAATEAMKDVWAAFIRTMARPIGEREAVARAEARAVAQAWLGMDDAEARAWYANEANRGGTYVRAPGDGPAVKGMEVNACIARYDLHKSKTQAGLVHTIFENQTTCLFNVVADGPGERDPYLHMPYSWNWKNPASRILNPPNGWLIHDEAMFEEGGAPVDMAVYKGRLYVIWVDETRAIYISSRTREQPWSAPARVSEWLSDGAPALTGTDAGLVMVHRGTDNRIYAAVAQDKGDGKLEWSPTVAADQKVITHHRPSLHTLGPALAEMIFRGDNWRLYFLQVKVTGGGGQAVKPEWSELKKLKPLAETSKKLLIFDVGKSIEEHVTVATPDLTTLLGRKYLATITRDKGFFWAELANYGVRDAKPARTKAGQDEHAWATASPPSLVGVDQKKALYLAHRGQDDLVYWGSIRDKDVYIDNHATTWRTYDAPVMTQFGDQLHLVYRATDGKLFNAIMDLTKADAWSAPVEIPALHPAKSTPRL